MKYLLVTLILLPIFSFCQLRKYFSFDGKKFHPLSDKWYYNQAIDSLVYSKNQDTMFVYHRKEKLRHFYYQWSYWTDKQNAWGEDDIYLNHTLTKKELYSILIKNSDLKGRKLNMTIQEVTDEQLHQLLSRDMIERTPDVIKSHYYYK